MKKGISTDQMEEVEMETNSLFRFFESKIPLFLDQASINFHKNVFYFLQIYLIIIFIASFISPKSHNTKSYTIEVSSNESATISAFLQTDKFLQENRSVSAYIQMTRKWNAHKHNHSENFWDHIRHHRQRKHRNNNSKAFYYQVYANVSFIKDNVITATKSIIYNNAYIPFSHHNLHSDAFPIFTLESNNSDLMNVSFSISGDFVFYKDIDFYFRVSNQKYTVFMLYAALTFGILGTVFFIILGIKCQRRFEQIFTLVFILLFLLSNMELVFDHKILCVAQKIMVCYTQLYLFYLIALISNKQKSFFSIFSYLLIFSSFLSDLIFIMKQSEPHFSFMNGHHIFWHFITLSVIESMIAAMYHTIDDPNAYFIYLGCISISFLSTLISDDLAVFFPELSNYMNLELFFMATNSVILIILFIYHRSYPQSNLREKSSKEVVNFVDEL